MSQFTDGNAEGYRKVPRLSRVPVLTKITLKSLAILMGNLAGTLRGAQVTCSPLIQTSNTECEIVKVISITDFFYDDQNAPYTPLPEPDLKRSPCFSIITINQGYFYCKLHPDVKNVHLESIGPDIKYKDPAIHKSELLRFPKLTHD